eukprot:scaffold3027_cov31-Tisochrysis_lutea.AAC.5
MHAIRGPRSLLSRIVLRLFSSEPLRADRPFTSSWELLRWFAILGIAFNDPAFASILRSTALDRGKERACRRVSKCGDFPVLGAPIDGAVARLHISLLTIRARPIVGPIGCSSVATILGYCIRRTAGRVIVMQPSSD